MRSNGSQRVEKNKNEDKNLLFDVSHSFFIKGREEV